MNAKGHASAPVGVKVIELVAELLVRRFHKLGREEIQAMMDLVPLRNTRVWQEAEQEGRAKGRQEGREEMCVELVQQWLAKGMAIQEIAALLDTTVQAVRRLRKNGRRGGCQ